MKINPLVILSVILALVTLALIIEWATLYGEIEALRTELEAVAGARPAPGATAGPTTSTTDWKTPVEVTILGNTAITGAATITFTARGNGVADPLQEAPVLVCGESQLPVEGASLETARRELLDLITAGEAQAVLKFSGEAQGDCTLILNPGQDERSSIALHMELPVIFLLRDQEQSSTGSMEVGRLEVYPGRQEFFHSSIFQSSIQGGNP